MALLMEGEWLFTTNTIQNAVFNDIFNRKSHSKQHFEGHFDWLLLLKMHFEWFLPFKIAGNVGFETSPTTYLFHMGQIPDPPV